MSKRPTLCFYDIHSWHNQLTNDVMRHTTPPKSLLGGVVCPQRIMGNLVISSRKFPLMMTSPIGFVCENWSTLACIDKNPRVCHPDIISELVKYIFLLSTIFLKYGWHTLERCLIFKIARLFIAIVRHDRTIKCRSGFSLPCCHIKHCWPLERDYQNQCCLGVWV